jgi:BTB/POZ domain-containing protein 3/6
MASNVDWQSTKNTSFSERNRHMFNNSDMSDIRLACECSEKTFYAHKYLLGTSSAVFRAMFYGDTAENGPIVRLPDTNEESLEQFLRFLYTEECTLTADSVVATMYLANKYIIPSLSKKCVNFLLENLNTANVLDILEPATRFKENELKKQCLKLIQSNTSEVVKSGSFNGISQMTLAILLNQDKLKIPEVELFQAVLKWIDSQCECKNLETTGENRRSIIGEAIYGFRFFGMSHAEFIQHVSKSGLLTAEEINLIYEKFLGFDSAALRWTLPNRKTENIVRFCRFPGKTKKLRTGWEYGGAADRLQFSVNEDVSLLGVHLFGEQGSEYLVTLEVEVKDEDKGDKDAKGAKVTERSLLQSYTSKRNQDDIPGFDVMLEKPIPLSPSNVVTLSATVISGPDSCSGDNGLSSVTLEGVTVTFIDSPCATNKTCVDHGQFHEIILAI